MFAYCNNNPVRYVDKDGRMADNYAGWGGELIGELLYEWITGDDHPNHQTRRVDEQVTREQINHVSNGVKSLWNAYQRGYELEQESIMHQAKLNIDMFDSPEDIERSLDIIGATAGFSTAVYDVAIIISSANPTAGAVIGAIAGIAFGIREIIRVIQ